MALISDNFLGTVLGPQWGFYDGQGDGSYQVSNNRLTLEVPSGISHNIFQSDRTGYVTFQTITNEDFDVSMQIGSEPGGDRVVGFVFSDDSVLTTWVRFDLYTIGASTNWFVGSSAADTIQQGSNTAGHRFLRVRRIGTAWEFYTSADGFSWTLRHSATLSETINRVGMWVGNFSSTPTSTHEIIEFKDLNSTVDEIVPDNLTLATEVEQISLDDDGTDSLVPNNIEAATSIDQILVDAGVDDLILGNLSSPAVVGAMGVDATELETDTFPGTTLDPRWTEFNQLGDGTTIVAGGIASSSIPSGIAHDIWDATRTGYALLQSFTTPDFDVCIHVVNQPGTDSVAGLIFGTDGALTDWVRFDFVAGNIFVGISPTTIRLNTSVSAAVRYLRVSKFANSWRFFTSENGTDWTLVYQEVIQLTVIRAGMWVGNYGSTPANTVDFLEFTNLLASTTDDLFPVDLTAATSIDSITVSEDGDDELVLDSLISGSDVDPITLGEISVLTLNSIESPSTVDPITVDESSDLNLGDIVSASSVDSLTLEEITNLIPSNITSASSIDQIIVSEIGTDELEPDDVVSETSIDQIRIDAGGDIQSVVTFDPIRLLIIENDPTGVGDTEIDLVDIYSDWKRWVQQNGGENSNFLPAFRYVGGDPITSTQNLGSTFFLTNGWRIKASERDHRLTIVGNIYTDPEGFSPFVPTDGTFNINYETRVSNLVDASVARLDLTQLLAAVYIDIERGVPGTGTGTGTPTNPVNNVADAFAIAERDKLREFKLRGSIVLDRNAEDWTFTGLSARQVDMVDINGFVVDGSNFSSCTLTGTMTGKIDADSCSLDVLFGLDGHFRRCGLTSSFLIADNANAIFDSCFSEVPGQAQPIVTLGNDSKIGFRNYSGGLFLSGSTDGNQSSVDMDPGQLILDATNVGGAILVRGTGLLDDFSDGATVYSRGLVQASHLDDIYRIHGLEDGSPLVVTKTSRQAGVVDQTITEGPTDTVTVERQ